MQSPSSSSSAAQPVALDLVLIGCGHAHAHVLKMLGMHRAANNNGVRITLVSDCSHTPYSGMLPGCIAGHYTAAEIHLDCHRLAAAAGARLVVARACGVTYDNDDKDGSNGSGSSGGGTVLLGDGRPPLRYDCLSIDIGSAPCWPVRQQVVGNSNNNATTLTINNNTSRSDATKNGDDDAFFVDDNRNSKTTTTPPPFIPVKPISSFTQHYRAAVRRFQDFCSKAAAMESQNKSSSNDEKNQTTTCTYTVAVVGGGAGGVELALAVQHHWQRLLLLLEADNQNTNNENNKSNNNNNNNNHNVAVDLRIVLVTRSATLLPSHNARVRAIFRRILRERRVRVVCNATVERIDPVVVDATTTMPDGDIYHTNKRTKQRFVVVSENNDDDDDDDYDNTSSLPLVDECFWCVTAGAADWLRDHTPFATTADGNFVRVDETYQVRDCPGVFAAGDCCHMDAHPRPKAGVFAVRAGSVLYENIRRYCTGQQQHLIRHRPQSTFLGLISTGDRYAVASKGSWFCWEGAWLWKVKDYIDRRWMAKYSTDLPDLQEMMEKQQRQRQLQNSWFWSRWFGRNSSSNKWGDPASIAMNPLLQSKPGVAEALAADPMRCGGCGAKVGSSTLSRVLKAVHRRQVERARQLGYEPPPPLDHDDAAVTPVPASAGGGGGGGGGALLQSMDYFREMIRDPFVFGKIVAVHALSDLHAMGATAQSALALAVVPFAADESITEDTLIHLLSGVSDILQDENVRMVGGHTCEGLELACGLSVQGFTDDPTKLLRKRGGCVGDKIVLTKPLGTGALFAAEMRARCTGAFVQEAVDCMTKSSYAASQVARPFNDQVDGGGGGVHACTDVTGFGLAGHLLEMLMANKGCESSRNLDSIGAVLNIKDIPFYHGALEASANGIYSSLQPANARNRRAVSNHAEAAKAFPVEYPLLFDPQTAGGLLFFVDPNQCQQFVEKLNAANVKASVIGELEKYEWKLSVASKENNDAAAVCTIGSGETATGLRIRIAF